jgi:hypothetical protein
MGKREDTFGYILNILVTEPRPVFYNTLRRKIYIILSSMMKSKVFMKNLGGC